MWGKNEMLFMAAKTRRNRVGGETPQSQNSLWYEPLNTLSPKVILRIHLHAKGQVCSYLIMTFSVITWRSNEGTASCELFCVCLDLWVCDFISLLNIKFFLMQRNFFAALC